MVELDLNKKKNFRKTLESLEPVQWESVSHSAHSILSAEGNCGGTGSQRSAPAAMEEVWESEQAEGGRMYHAEASTHHPVLVPEGLLRNLSSVEICMRLFFWH